MTQSTSDATSQVRLTDMANAIRALSMDAVEAAKSGHPGMPMGMADVATVLFTQFLKFDASASDWADRDRFVLSAGHGSTLLYSLLHLTGYPDMTIEQIKNFRQLGAITAGHPEYGHAQGIEMTTGPLGQGIATAVGMALAERMQNARYGDDLVDHHTYVIVGDGCLMEGISQEAIDFAGHLKLDRLIVLFDDNGISIDGNVGLTTSIDQTTRFAASGWDVTRVDGHNPEEVATAIAAAKKTGTPSMIACKTVIGYGAPNKQGSASTHGAPLGTDEIAATRKNLGWPHAPFEIPDDILSAWRAAGSRGKAAREAWTARLHASDAKKSFIDTTAGALPDNLAAAVIDIKKNFSTEKPKLATRQSSQKVLEILTGVVPYMIGGSADLTGSNGTITKRDIPVSADQMDGTYIHYGVREHGMAAAMNGMALHGGFIPFSGTFLVFADYCRPAIRLAALMGIRVIHVMTHDSIGLGEDGPTHQPVEHMASLRVMPNVLVFRPADAVEMAECWQSALEQHSGPSILCLTRQGLPTLRTEHTDENRAAKGAYVLSEPEGPRDITLLATGSEVDTAMQAAEILAGEGTRAAVVSMPCMELFAAQSAAYQTQVLGDTPKVAVEAAVADSWYRWLGADDTFVGMTGFGASAPAGDLFEHFGITPKAVADACRKRLA